MEERKSTFERRIVLMCDYSADPVWSAENGANLELDDFPFSDRLKDTLRSWSAWYETTFLGPTIEWRDGQRETFTEFGRKLWEWAKDEAPFLEIGYFDEAKRERVPA